MRAAALYLCLVLVATAPTQFHRPITNGHVPSKIEGAGLREAANLRVVETYGKLPLTFEANQGQTDSEVRFLSRGSAYSLFLTSTEAVLSLKKKSEERAVLRMKLVGANRSPPVSGVDELPGKNNYFIGNDPAKWRTNVPTYAKVRYQNVYSGIDLVYYGNQRQLEYDFVVAPGVDPRAIRLAFDGKDEMRIDGQGNLVLEAEGSEIRFHQPVIYQEINGARQSVNGGFVMHSTPGQVQAGQVHDGRQVGFEVARYDASKPLVIDPVLKYSTYLGGSSDGGDNGLGIAVDTFGNAYVTGQTSSSDFPTLNAFQTAYRGGPMDTFVTKLNAAGSALIYSTYLGGSGWDYGTRIAVDSSGNAYVTGFTDSANFPITANAFQAAFGGGLFRDAFVTKLNATGSALVYSSYLGGSGWDEGVGIAVDSSGNAYVTGSADSTNFPITASVVQAAPGGNGDVFVTKLNAAGSALVYSTYLGGSGSDAGSGIAVDSSGNTYVAGYTGSTNFPITANAFQAAFGGGFRDAFVTKLNAAGSALVYSTYLGGADAESGHDIAVDSSGSAYLTGPTSSTNFPTVNALQTAFSGSGPSSDSVDGDAFVTKLNAAGSALVYSTYLGGSGGDSGSGIAVDSSGNAYVTGGTASTNFPTANAFQAGLVRNSQNELPNAFITKLNAAGSALVYSTYLGGSGGSSGGDFGSGIAVDSSGNAYVTGTTFSTDFPTANAFQRAKSNDTDAFVTKFRAVTAGPLPPPQLTQGAIVNGASFAAGAPVAPGSIISVFGSNLAAATMASGSIPLLTGLLNTSVTINGLRIPLYYVSPTQINAQVPFETPAGTAVLAVNVNGVLSSAVTFPAAAAAPGIFLYGANRTVAQNPDGSINAADRPAKPGDVIVLYMTGQGAVSNPIPTGSPALASPLSMTLATTTATIGGANAEVRFSGLAPRFVGLLQVNIRIPNVASGDQPLLVTIGGVASKSALITVASQ